MSLARKAFSERADNQDGFTPENVVFFADFMLSGGDLDGGGLSFGSGDLIEAARKLLADERISANHDLP